MTAPAARRTPVLLAILLALALVAAGGCGLSEDSQPEVLSADEIPPGLLDDTTSSSEPARPDLGVPVIVYVTEQDDDTIRLARLSRAVPDAGSVADRIDALLTEPPTESEQTDGLVSLLPGDLELLSAEVNDDRSEIVLDLAPDLNVQGERLRAALAQLVWTATETPGHEQAEVRFEINGDPTTAIDGQGNERDAVTRTDYRELRPAVAE